MADVRAPVQRAATAPPSAAALSGHVVVCGLRGVGVRTVEQLHLADVDVVVVDDDPDGRMADVVRAWGVPHVAGPATSPQTLLAAGLDRAAALVCVLGDDLATLETALLARELCPQVRVVVELANPAVGRAVASVIGAQGVLDVAALAAPSVVEACLRTGAHELDLDGEPLVAARMVVPASATLREVFGDLAPLVVEPVDGGEPVVGPGRDLPVGAGDAVTLLGTTAELDATGLEWGAARRRDRRSVQVRPGRVWPGDARPRRRSPLRVAAELLAGELDRRLRLVLLALVLVVLTSTTVLRVGYHEADGTRMSVLDALYFTVETVGTVGYGDFYFRDQPDWLRVWAIGLMITGAALATVFFAMLTNLLVSRRIEESLGRRRVPGMAGHAVVVGVGSVGLRVVEQLLARHSEVVVVEQDPDNRYLAQVRALGVPVVVGDATLPATLERANLAAAGSVAVLTSDDLTNIETGLAVRDRLGQRWATTPVVLRMFDRQLAATVERTFGFHHVRSTAALAAPWFVGAALGLDVLSTFYVGGVPLLLARLTVRPGGGLDGTAMRHLGARLRVVGIRPGTEPTAVQHPPRRDAVLRGGDIAYVLGPYEELLAVLRRQ